MNITAANTFTSSILVQAGQTFDVSVSGTFVASAVVQRSKDGVTWLDVETFTAPAQKSGVSGSAWYYRIGVPTGGFTSGTVVVDLYD
ncbi:hypothetical protein GOC72_18670 [Sinorhizobium medicae]|nr:hypothetical protein [Sinorhizobium medicae]